MRPVISALQLTSCQNYESNRARIEQQLDKLCNKIEPSLVLLPENAFSFGFHAREILSCAETFGSGQVQETVANWAKEYHCYLALGSIYLKGMNGKVFKSLLIFSPEGKCLQRYDKMHLFDVCLANGEKHFESEVVLTGQQPVVAATEFATLGLSICYDLRFPELYQALKYKGAQIILMPAAFTRLTGKAHWMTLLRARAIETQCYLLAANQWGTHYNGRETFGHSAIIDPWGEVLSLREAEEGFVVASFVEEEINKRAAQIPCFKHKNGYFSHE